MGYDFVLRDGACELGLGLVSLGRLNLLVFLFDVFSGIFFSRIGRVSDNLIIIVVIIVCLDLERVREFVLDNLLFFGFGATLIAVIIQVQVLVERVH